VSSSTIAIQEGLALARWTPAELWRACLGIGGSFTGTEIADFASGSQDATRTDHNILASALNEHFVARGQNHPVPVWEQLG
jgi:hypothetical protein